MLTLPCLTEYISMSLHSFVLHFRAGASINPRILGQLSPYGGLNALYLTLFK